MCQCLGLHAAHAFLDHVAKTSKGTSMPMLGEGVECSPKHWHTFPTVSGATWPRTVGGKYAKVRAKFKPKQWHTFSLLCWATWPRTSKGNICQWVQLHAAPSIGTLSPYFSGPHGPDKLGNICQCLGLHADAPIGILVPFFAGPYGPRQVGGKYAHRRRCMQPHALAYVSLILLGPCGPIK